MQITREKLYAIYVSQGLTEKDAGLACDNVLKQNGYYDTESADLLCAFVFAKTDQGHAYWYEIFRSAHDTLYEQI
jgi:hypothetical protein